MTSPLAPESQIEDNFTDEAGEAGEAASGGETFPLLPSSAHNALRRCSLVAAAACVAMVAALTSGQFVQPWRVQQPANELDKVKDALLTRREAVRFDAKGLIGLSADCSLYYKSVDGTVQCKSPSPTPPPPPNSTNSTNSTTSTPAPTPTPTCGTQSRLLVPPFPRRVLYIDNRSITYYDPTLVVRQAVDAGYNYILLAFLTANAAGPNFVVPVDMALVWQGASCQAQVAAVNYAHQRGAVVMVSAGGSTDSQWYQFPNGSTYGTYVGAWAVANFLDGVDFDVENINSTAFTAGRLSSSQLVQYLATASGSAKNYVQIVSHAPQPRYFAAIGGALFSGTGGYSGVALAATFSVDFYSVQFVNQGVNCYTTYSGLFTNSASDCPSNPGTSVNEISSYGVPIWKIVVLKVLLPTDAGSGYVSDSVLNSFFLQARALFYFSGVSCYQWGFNISTNSTNSTSSTEWIDVVCSNDACIL